MHSCKSNTAALIASYSFRRFLLPHGPLPPPPAQQPELGRNPCARLLRSSPGLPCPTGHAAHGGVTELLRARAPHCSACSADQPSRFASWLVPGFTRCAAQGPCSRQLARFPASRRASQGSRPSWHRFSPGAGARGCYVISGRRRWQWQWRAGPWRSRGADARDRHAPAPKTSPRPPWNPPATEPPRRGRPCGATRQPRRRQHCQSPHGGKTAVRAAHASPRSASRLPRRDPRRACGPLPRPHRRSASGTRTGGG